MVYTKPGADVFAPTDGGGAPRSVVNSEAQVWATEVEQNISTAVTDAENAVAAAIAELGQSYSNTTRPLLVVATGQSNMLAVSTAEGGDRTTEPGVFVWEQFPGGGQTTGWKEAGPDSPDWPFLAGTTSNAGIAYTFCRILRRVTGRPVYLIMYAAGGQQIAEWRPGGGGVGSATGAMRIALWASYRDAIASAPMTAAGITTADYVLWHQGEADNDDNPDSGGSQWLSRFEAVIAQMRAPETSFDDVVIARSDTPILVGELLVGGTEGGAPGVGATTDDRNTEIRSLAGRSDPYLMPVSSIGLLSNDNLHMTARSLEDFAYRYYSAAMQLPKRSVNDAFLPSSMANKTLTGTVNIGAAYSSTGANNGWTRSGDIVRTSVANAAETWHYAFYNPNGVVGSIRTNASATSFNTSSDETWKRFLGEYDPQKAVEIIRADPVREWNWIEEKGGGYAIGWGAQTSYAVSPDLAAPGGWFDPETGEACDEGQEGAEYMPWGVDQSKRTPYLWAAMTAVLDRLEAAEARIEELEGR